MTETQPQHRPIRSFVRREGRMTPAQLRALEVLLPRFGFPTNQGMVDLDALFGRRTERFLEIGFGAGQALLETATAHPERDYLGIEVHRPGVGALLLRADKAQLNNLRVACGDAVQIIATALPDHSMNGIALLFPDPWHKKKHHKRRIVRPDFVALIARKLMPGGRFHLATDWQDYAEHMMAVMSASAEFVNCAGPGRYAERGERVLTKYEQRGQRLGHSIWDLLFERAVAPSKNL